MAKDLLVEIGTEELPPTALSKLSEAFLSNFVNLLNKNQIEHGVSEVFATPRRLAFTISDLSEQAPEQHIEKLGPYLSAAYKEGGEPTPAASGFARSCNTSLESLSTKQTDKGERLYFVDKKPGITTKEKLAEFVEDSLNRLPIPKRMRWSDKTFEFVRPIHWVILLFGQETINDSVFGIEAKNTTYGHRFHSDGPLQLSEPKEYESILEKGHVVASFDKRKNIIQKQMTKLVSSHQAVPMFSPALLDEVTALVEWPVALCADFDEKFLNVPKEALVSAMEQHQKCFPMFDALGALLPKFIAVSNIDSREPQNVISGNQRVMRARLADAEFFYETDQKTRLLERLERLKAIIHQKSLGTLFDKVERMKKLSAVFASELSIKQDDLSSAIELCKCDLTTDMVNEFPKLQGLMGGYYAKADGYSDDIALAIREHYKPIFSGDDIPSSTLGKVISLVDKIDTIVGIFKVGLKPTGEKDPFGLRRACLGVIRIIIESDWTLDVNQLIAASVKTFEGDSEDDLTEDVMTFFFDRLRHTLLEDGVSVKIINAVMANKPTKVLDFKQRVEALESFLEMKEAKSLAAANKRVKNILSKQAEEAVNNAVENSLLVSPAEKDLAKAIASVSSKVVGEFEVNNYKTALKILSELQTPVDRFFEEVLVMDDDEALRYNRLALLASLHRLFSEVADFSELAA